MGEVTTLEIALKMIVALFKEGIINEATYNKIMKKYKTEVLAKA